MFTFLAARARSQSAGNEEAQTPLPLRLTKTLLRLCAGVAAAFYIQWRNSVVDLSEVIFPPETPFVAVDNHTKIFQNDQFLSAEEVQYLLNFIENLGGWGPSDGAEHLELPLAGFVEDARKDPIVARVEERIANATGIPVHPHEDLLSFTRVQSRGSKPREGYFPPDGLHHDSHQRPHRAWSMIVYLQVPEEGGRTIFPLAGPVPKDGDLAMRHVEFAAALQDLYGGKEQNYSRRAYFDVSSDHPFMDLIEESCRGEYGLSLQVSPGTAVLFPSSSRSVRTWHAGCNVIKGSKIILQKFKEYPLQRRSSDEPLPLYRPFRE
ncbi:unnamed protein product [Durusdinium trenchii]|uniref:Prolyl 4-hydroxylase alpha subunit domain-containing protein n=1 Tax=Durusdinium trenchii TaxID=1381693 RepID=A0ABP0PU36_9DINO